MNRMTTLKPPARTPALTMVLDLLRVDRPELIRWVWNDILLRAELRLLEVGAWV